MESGHGIRITVQHELEFLIDSRLSLHKWDTLLRTPLKPLGTILWRCSEGLMGDHDWPPCFREAPGPRAGLIVAEIPAWV